MTQETPAVYEADVDEMTAGALAALLEVRNRLGLTFAGQVVDDYAAELVSGALDEDDDQDCGGINQ